MNVLVIGAGNMGITYAEGMMTSSIIGRKRISVYDIDPDKKAALRSEGNFDVYDRLEDCVPEADIIFIAVKPYHSQALFDEMKSMVNNDQIIVSVMAGVSLHMIHEGLEVDKIVRTMPNLPAQVGKGVTSYTESPTVTRVELMVIRNLLDTTGRSIHVDSEKFIDASTGISGSGPAYVFYFMESMMEAARKMGFSAYDSSVLVSHTFEGAVALFNQNSLSPQKWMDRVASKGGTTRAALDSMEDNNVKEQIKEAAYAAFNRAVELGEDPSSK